LRRKDDYRAQRIREISDDNLLTQREKEKSQSVSGAFNFSLLAE
jgi:hypothetical protein